MLLTHMRYNLMYVGFYIFGYNILNKAKYRKSDVTQNGIAFRGTYFSSKTRPIIADFRQMRARECHQILIACIVINNVSIRQSDVGKW